MPVTHHASAFGISLAGRAVRSQSLAQRTSDETQTLTDLLPAENRNTKARCKYSLRFATIGLDWIEQGLTSPPTQYRLSGRRDLRQTNHKSAEQATMII